MGLPLSAADVEAGTVEFACTSPKYLRNSFIPAIMTQSTEQFVQFIYLCKKHGSGVKLLVIWPLILPALESNQTTHPKGSTDNSYTKWFIENQDTAYRLGKLYKMVICCLLTNKISIFIPNARLLFNSFF